MKQSYYIFILTLLLFRTVLAQNLSLQDRLKSPLVAAHRGGFFEKSNNTIEQFKNAIEQNVDILEMDLRLTKDGVVVVFHDEELSNHTSCKGFVKDLNSEYVLSCSYKKTGHRIPMFEEVLKVVNGKAIINGEFKELEVVEPVVALVKKYKALNWTYFQANADREKYFLARHLDPDLGLLFKAFNDEDLDFIDSLKDSNLLVVHFNKQDITEKRIHRVHAMGKLVSVNSWKYDLLEERFKSTCKKMYELGVDIPVTNNSAHCMKIKNQMGFYL